MNNRSRALINIFAATDTGPVRSLNEDRFSLSDVATAKIYSDCFAGEIGEQGVLMIVSDGAGGDGRGEIASELAIHIFQEEIFNGNRTTGIGEQLIRAANVANELIWDQSRRVQENAGMAATLTAVWIVPPQVYVVEVGDSRAYLVRGNTIKQLTRDQSMIQTLIDGGVVTPNTARTHPYRNIVLQSLGARQTVVPVVSSLTLARGDRLVICSDGLNKRVSDEQMCEVVVGCQDVDSICRLLIETAKEQNADDNITVVAAIIDGDAFSLPDQAPILLMEAADESELSDELEDLTNILSPASSSEDDQSI